MITIIESWVVGIVLALLLMRIVNLHVKGLIAIIYLTVVPYFLGKILLTVIGYH